MSVKGLHPNAVLDREQVVERLKRVFVNGEKMELYEAVLVKEEDRLAWDRV